MTEQALNNLFDKARSEAPETNINEIQKWIGFTGIFALLAGFAFKFKTIFISKIILMTSSIIVAASVAVGAYFFYSTSEKKTPTKQESQLIQQDLQRQVTLLPVIDKSSKEIQPSTSEVPISNVQIEETPIWEALLPLKQFASNPYSLDTGKIILPITKTDEYGNFDAIKVSGVVEVVLIQGSDSGVRIEADEAGKRVVRISNDNGTLKIHTETNGKKDMNFELIVYVTFKELKKIHCSGVSDIKSQGELKLEDLFLNVSGASEIELALKVNHFKIESSGASEIELTGSANDFELIHSGASELKAHSFMIKKADLVCSGASDAKIHVSDHLKMVLSGASDVKYKGNPTVEQNITGVSSVKHI